MYSYLDAWMCLDDTLPMSIIKMLHWRNEIFYFLIENKGALAIRRIFSLVDMITKPKFSNCPNVFKIGLFR